MWYNYWGQVTRIITRASVLFQPSPKALPTSLKFLTRIAHHDAIRKGDQRLLYGEMQQLVEEVKAFYNSLTSYHDQSTTLFDYLVREAERHTSQVVNIMREERDRSVRRFKKSDTAI
jgi:hypothetical protein